MTHKILLVLAVLSMPALLQAADAEVPATGQTTCYDTAGVLIPCTSTGQDGDLQKGVAWPVPRFVNNGDGTVTDNLTGLMWMTEADCVGNLYPAFDSDGTGGDGKVFWLTALDFVDDVNAAVYGCGVSTSYADWRLPNVRELESLVDLSQHSPALPAGHPFTGVASYYWSSTSINNNASDAWVVDFLYGYTSDELNPLNVVDKASSANYIWPVRAGQ